MPSCRDDHVASTAVESFAANQRNFYSSVANSRGAGAESVNTATLHLRVHSLEWLLRVLWWETFPSDKALIMQTVPTIDPVADPPEPSQEEPGEPPQRLPEPPREPEADPLVPGASLESEPVPGRK